MILERLIKDNCQVYSVVWWYEISINHRIDYIPLCIQLTHARILIILRGTWHNTVVVIIYTRH